MAVLNIPILRWGQPYTSLETDDVKHFLTGEALAKVSQANTGLLSRDMRLAPHARQVLTEISVAELIGLMKKAADLYLNASLPLGDGEQSPDDFARQQSASPRPWAAAHPPCDVTTARRPMSQSVPRGSSGSAGVVGPSGSVEAASCWSFVARRFGSLASATVSCSLRSGMRTGTGAMIVCGRWCSRDRNTKMYWLWSDCSHQ